MPTEDGVRSDDRGHLRQSVATPSFTFDGQYTALIVVQQDSLVPQTFQ